MNPVNLKVRMVPVQQTVIKSHFHHHILLFLERQGLIEYIEADEMVAPTRKLDQFMDFNLLNQNNYKRVLKLLSEVSNEQN